MLTTETNSILILPPELLEAIGDYLPRNHNSHADSLFNLAFSCKLLFNVLSPKIYAIFENYNSRWVNLENYLSDDKEYPFQKTMITPLGQRIATYTQIYIITCEVLWSDHQKYFPKFKDLKTLDLCLEYDYDLLFDDEFCPVASTVGYSDLFGHIGHSYANLTNLFIQRFNWCAESCRVLSELLESLTALQVLQLELVQGVEWGRSHDEIGASPDNEDLSECARSISNLKRLEKLSLTCRPSFVGLLLEYIFRELVNAPIKQLKLTYRDALSEDAENALEQLINMRNLHHRRFEELHLGEDITEAMQSFCTPTDATCFTSNYIPVDFSCIEASSFADLEVSSGKTTDVFTDLRNLEAFYFGKDYSNRSRYQYEENLPWISPFVLTALKESSNLRVLEFLNLAESQLNDAIDILNHISCLDHFSISILNFEDPVALDCCLEVFMDTIESCTMRRKLKSLTLKSTEFLQSFCLERLLDVDVRVEEIVMDVNEEVFEIIEKCFLIMGGKEKKKLKFLKSSVYDELVFDLNEHVLKLERTLCEENVNIFPEILKHVHRVVLDNVRDEFVDQVMELYVSEFERMGVHLGVVGVEYCLYRNSQFRNLSSHCSDY